MYIDVIEAVAAALHVLAARGGVRGGGGRHLSRRMLFTRRSDALTRSRAAARGGRSRRLLRGVGRVRARREAPAAGCVAGARGCLRQGKGEGGAVAAGARESQQRARDV